MDAFIEVIKDGLMTAFHSEYLVVFLISMLPMIEVKGAIPIGISLGLNPWVAFVFSVLSSLVVAPIILFCLKPILNALKKTKWFNKFAQSVEDVFVSKAEKTEKRERTEGQKNFIKMFMLFLFVALPLPLTGVWTGCGVAVFMQKKYRYSIIPIVLGCVVQGIIFTLISAFAPAASGWVVLVVSVFVLISLSIFIAQTLIKRHKRKKADAVAVVAASDDKIATKDDNGKSTECSAAETNTKTDLNQVEAQEEKVVLTSAPTIKGSDKKSSKEDKNDL